MNFENSFIKKQVAAQKKFQEDLSAKIEEDHNQKINELHLEAQNIHSELIKNSTDLEDEHMAEMAFMGDIEGIEKVEKKRNENMDEILASQEKILQEMDRKGEKDKLIDFINKKPFSLN